MKVGILGAGQLAKMLIEAGQKIGVECVVFSETPGTIANPQLVTLGRFDDVSAVKSFLEGCELVTYEWENLPLKELEQAIAGSSEFFPTVEALKVIADRFIQKKFFRKLGIETTDFYLIDGSEVLKSKIKEVGLGGILKTTRFGYDGKGQLQIKSEKELEGAWEVLGGVPLLYEKFVPFDRELSLIACRSSKGEMKFYPLVENIHRGGILRKTLAPAENVTQHLTAQAQQYAREVFKSFDYVGVLALELFQCGEQLLLNEMASRVHNTGHWTIEGAQTSQFENHLRAGLGLELGSTEAKGFSAMINLISKVPSQIDELSGDSIHLHLYGKSPKPNRKLGHVTLLGKSREEVQKKTESVEQLIL